MSFLQTNTERERHREKQLYGCNTWFGDRKEKTARLSAAAAAAATTGFAAATTSCKLQQLPMPPCKLKLRGNNHYQQPASQQASSKRNKIFISDLSENLQSKIAIKHSELHSVS
jgi:cell division septal protein FtsQ